MFVILRKDFTSVSVFVHLETKSRVLYPILIKVQTMGKYNARVHRIKVIIESLLQNRVLSEVIDDNSIYL